MLILVGVTVTVSLNGGLFDKAREASKGTQKEIDKEKLNMAVAFAYDTETGEIDASKIKEDLGEDWEVKGTGGPYLCKNTKTNTELIVTKDGEITEEELLVVTCKVNENKNALVFIPENGFDYENVIIKFLESDLEEPISSLEEALEAIGMTEDAIKNELGENFTTEDYCRYLALYLKCFDGSAYIDGFETGYEAYFELSEGQSMEDFAFEITIDDKTWTYIGKNSIVNQIKLGDKFYFDQKINYQKQYYSVIYNDKENGLQLIADFGCTASTGSLDKTLFAQINNSINNTENSKFKIKDYAKELRNVGGPFTKDLNTTDEIVTDNNYVEDLERIEKFSVVSANWYVRFGYVFFKFMDYNRRRTSYKIYC